MMFIFDVVLFLFSVELEWCAVACSGHGSEESEQHGPTTPDTLYRHPTRPARAFPRGESSQRQVHLQDPPGELLAATSQRTVRTSHVASKKKIQAHENKNQGIGGSRRPQTELLSAGSIDTRWT